VIVTPDYSVPILEKRKREQISDFNFCSVSVYVCSYNRTNSLFLHQIRTAEWFDIFFILPNFVTILLSSTRFS